MGNNISSPPPMLRENLFPPVAKQDSSLSSQSKIIIVVCIGFIIWKVFTKSCPQKNELLESIQNALQRDLDMLNRDSRTCMCLMEPLKSIIPCLPTNGDDRNLLRINVDRLTHRIKCINENRISIEEYQKEMEKHISNPRAFFNASAYETNQDVAMVLYEVISDCLEGNILEKLFWDNITQIQKELLEQLIDKLKSTYPNMPECQLRSTVVYVFNKYKRGVFPNEMRRIEAYVERELGLGPEPSSRVLSP